MRGVATIWKKEVRTYATSARWYVLAAIAVSITSVFFFVANLSSLFGRMATFEHVAGFLAFPILMVVTPIFTMRLFAEEANRGTLELLLTSPVRDWEIVAGKFFGALTAYLAILVVSLVYPFVLFRFSEPDLGVMLAQYLGLIALSAAFISVGMFTSALTESQILAAVFSFLLLVALWILPWLADAVSEQLGEIGQILAPLPHLENFNRGLIDSVDVFYYLAFTAIFLVLSLRFLEARRWAG